MYCKAPTVELETQNNSVKSKKKKEREHYISNFQAFIVSSGFSIIWCQTMHNIFFFFFLKDFFFSIVYLQLTFILYMFAAFKTVVEAACVKKQQHLISYSH